MATKALVRYPCGCCFEKINGKYQLVTKDPSCKIRHSNRKKRKKRVRG